VRRLMLNRPVPEIGVHTQKPAVSFTLTEWIIMVEPRTRDTQAIPSRPARSHHNKQRGTRFSINGQNLEEHFARYVTNNYPDTPVLTRKNMVSLLMYAAKHDQPIPTPNELNQLFEGEIETPSSTPLNPRQNG
jgi:hypothetical protein